MGFTTPCRIVLRWLFFCFSSTLGFCGEAHFMIHPVALFRGSCVLCARDGKILQLDRQKQAKFKTVDNRGVRRSEINFEIYSVQVDILF